MSVFNDDNNELKHPAFHDEQIKKKKMWAKILDVLLPIVKGLPIIPKNIKTLLVDLEKYTQIIKRSKWSLIDSFFSNSALQFQ